MIAGIVFGPHTPGLDFVTDPADFELVATLGLVLLLFYLGLEFSINELIQGGRKLVLAGSIYLALNVGAGLAFGFALGWGNREAFVIAGAVGISSSAIVTKLLVELNRLANGETRLILGIIVVEDLFLALYLAALQPIIGDTEGVGDAIISIAKAFGFLLLLAIIARKGAPLVGRLIDTDDNELLTICFVGLVLLVAGTAEELGVSDAIGAFMTGLILAESPSSERIKRLVRPLRDTFAAVFFFAFGLTIEPDDIASLAGTHRARRGHEPRAQPRRRRDHRPPLPLRAHAQPRTWASPSWPAASSRSSSPRSPPPPVSTTGSDPSWPDTCSSSRSAHPSSRRNRTGSSDSSRRVRAPRTAHRDGVDVFLMVTLMSPTS